MNTHEIIQKTDGTFGLKRISSGCVYGSFGTWAEAAEAMAVAAAVDASGRQE